MPDKIKPIQLVLCWHMHQPEYRDRKTGQFQLPWTYLHAIKDYADMVAHLEVESDARAVINFAPILLEQLEDYAIQIEAWLGSGQALRDPLLAGLGAESMPAAPEQRMWLAQSCLKANRTRMIEPWPIYKGLVDMVTWMQHQEHTIDYVSDQFLADLLVWYHLAWMGETIRRSDARIKHLIAKGTHFTLSDRRNLIEVIGENLTRLLDRYQILAKQGRIELSITPYGHPIMPLMIDLNCAREAWPEVILPDTLSQYPGGEARVRWHIEHGKAVFERIFGMSVGGCWPSEGSISGPTLDLLGDMGFKWAASGETVLANSLKISGKKLKDSKSWLYRSYRHGNSGIQCFFRDDKLSDAIGFTYSTWHGDDAAANFVHELETLADDPSGAGEMPRIVSVVLDGENAWEYYPANGYYFLSKLYQLLAEHPKIQMTTFTDALQLRGQIELVPGVVGRKPTTMTSEAATGNLKTIISGSWVYGTFSTWIGDHDKNQGWLMLVEAKQAYDRAVAENSLAPDALERATEQLAICEGSDWCWWFGDYNPSGSVSDFERLYRLHLSNLYQLLGVASPEYLAHSFTYGGGDPATGGTMRKGQDSP
ncbi:glycoside hydrolase [Acidihalobacter yilgarnensis]|uniref:Glycoside hydrolase n=1 Tax=Acidihalobacter yilgarnensis TaxID=2819280 RepID=A0A1D8IND5_9GAMM|nr:glycoside hydrolase family 57 protein [Acidihalobacter yilgarnensis]AOU97986.1 glycoside hydrolase [Acidihalobacter yilgarnensis]